MKAAVDNSVTSSRWTAITENDTKITMYVLVNTGLRIGPDFVKIGPVQSMTTAMNMRPGFI